MAYREGMEKTKRAYALIMLLNAQEKVETGITIKNIILALYILGLSSSVALFFSYIFFHGNYLYRFNFRHQVF